jgi:phage-related protein
MTTTAFAQAPAPITPITPKMKPGQDYNRMKVQVDQFFDFIFGVFDQIDDVMIDIANLVDDIQRMMIADGSIMIGDQSYTLDTIISSVSQPVHEFFSFRCYIDSSLVNWTLLLIAWMMIVMLIKLLISMMPFAMQLVDFIWGKVVDIWQSIPFI